MFTNGSCHGLGKHFYPDGSVYNGDFQNDLPHGWGTLKHADGSLYIGDFQKGYSQGVGTMVYRHGDKYEGLWDQGKRHGVGTMTYLTKDGSVEKIYKGNWRNDQKCGEGKTIWKMITSTISYGGQYKNDLPNGKGLMIYWNNEQYAGFWVDGLRHGYGEQSLPDGRMIYEGIWANDKYEG